MPHIGTPRCFLLQVTESGPRTTAHETEIDVAVIGGGQTALAVGYYLRRTGLSFTLLDNATVPGGAWTRTWRSLRLFSPSQWSSLPGYLMPRTAGEYPTRDEVIDYLTEYERRYELPVVRPVNIDRVSWEADYERFLIGGDGGGRWHARAVVSATGSWANPYFPSLPGRDGFAGEQLHSANYLSPEPFVGRRVVVVGGGNSGAQIVSELSRFTDVTWATLTPPVFLPDDVDGRYLFEQATRRYKAIQEGRIPDPPRSLGDIVSVPTVREARDRGALVSRPMFTRLTTDGVVWPDGSESQVDVVIWATGFRPALAHLSPLRVIGENGRVETAGTRATRMNHLWLVGYGEWTGYASATLIGVGRSARATVDDIVTQLAAPDLPKSAEQELGEHENSQ
jgi:cation diffusion facilitator CzcD-associated flavoprotein CzcO